MTESARAKAFATGFVNGFVEGLVAGPLAAFNPLALWLGHILLDYSVPSWAYVAVWLITFDVIAGELRRAGDDR